MGKEFSEGFDRCCFLNVLHGQITYKGERFFTLLKGGLMKE